MSDSTVSKDVITIERIFDAPVDLIWKLWTQPEHLKQWYGPKGFSVPVADLDVRVGGRHLICMESQTPEGSMRMWLVGEYTEIVPNQRLVYTDSMADEQGNLLLPSAFGMEGDYPMVTVVTVLLEDMGGRTKMVVTHTGVPTDDEGAIEGWKQAFTKLAGYLETVPNR